MVEKSHSANHPHLLPLAPSRPSLRDPDDRYQPLKAPNQFFEPAAAMAYNSNPYNQAPSTEAGYNGGYDNYSQPYAQQEQHEMQPYGGQQQGGWQNAPQQDDQYGQQQQQPAAPAGNFMSQSEFLSRISAIREDMKRLEGTIQKISGLQNDIIYHRNVSSNEDAQRAQIQTLVDDTRLKNTAIRSQIQQLKGDAERSTDGSFGLKKRQYETINNEFKALVGKYFDQESQFQRHHLDGLRRQYRVVNPNATDQEVSQAIENSGGNIFQQALATNRGALAEQTLVKTRARQAEFEKMERTLMELKDLFDALGAQLELQEPVVANVGQLTEQTKVDLVNANQQIDKGIDSARRRRKLKWWCLLVVVLIVLAVALGVGLGLTLTKNATTPK